MRVVFEDYWRDLREGMEREGIPLPPPDLEAFIGELREQGVAEVRLCMRWLHVLNVEASGSSLPALDALARSPYMHFGTYLLATARTSDGLLFEYRQRHYPEDGQPHELLEQVRSRLEEAGFRVLNGRWQV